MQLQLGAELRVTHRNKNKLPVFGVTTIKYLTEDVHSVLVYDENGFDSHIEYAVMLTQTNSLLKRNP